MVEYEGGENRRWLTFIGACLLICGTYLLLTDLVNDRSPLPENSRLDRAELALLDTPTLAAFAAADKQSVTLTHTVCCSARAIGYRISFDAPGEHDLGLIPVLGADNFHAYVNGVAVRKHGSLGPYPTYHGMVREVTRVPRGILRARDNHLDIIAVRTASPYFDVYPSYVADFDTMQARFAWSGFMMAEVRMLSIAAMGIVACAALLLALQIRNRSVALWLFALSGAWALHSAFYHWYDFPWDGTWRVSYFMTLAQILPLAWLGFVSAIIAGEHRAWRWLLGGAATLTCAGIASSVIWLRLDHATGFDAASHIVNGLGFVCYGGAWIRVASALVRSGARRVWESALFLVCLSLFLVDVIGETFYQQAWGNGTNVAPLFLGALLLAMIARNVRWHESLTAFNLELAEQVQAREAEIQQNYAALARAERDKELAEERQRIMRDMHDGVGGRLAALTGVLSQTNGRSQTDVVAAVNDAVSDALQDLRLMVDSLDVLPDDLGLALGTLRPRLQRWIAHHDIELHWRCDLAAAEGYGPQAALDIYRVVQEACNNVVRHARAQSLWVAAVQTPEGILLTVEDDGDGIEPGAHIGKGTANMQSRAARLGGSLCVSARHPRGTRVALALPAVRQEMREP
ncbi:MAG: ATP-binding protein [Pseudomonadota bacterium]